MKKKNQQPNEQTNTYFQPYKQIKHVHTVTRESREPERYVDPAMIGILAGMALMFVIICVVLRLFSR